MNSAGAIVNSGALWLALPIALAAGLLSFVSPCVLPLVPGYLGYVSGLTEGGPSEGGTTDGAARRRSRMVLGAAFFVIGFSVVFLAVFLLAGTVGVFVFQWRDLIIRVGGAVIILLGLVFIGQVTVFQRNVKLTWRPRAGLLGAPLLGVVFAVGWTPCTGPTLIAVSNLAGYGGDPGRALIIGIAYCLGLGVPFLLVALGFGWVGGSIAWVKRHIRAINIAGGALLIVVGVLMVSGVWNALLSSVGAVINGFANPL